MRFLQSILSSFICLIAASQTIIPRFETFGVNEGLSQNSVYAILQDKEGFMWFSTADGLNRYDGDEIKMYKTKPDFEKSRNSNFIRGRLCEDDKKNIWFSTETGIYFYDRLDDIVKPGYLFTQQKTDVYYYYLISCDRNNTLWLYNRHSAIISWNIKSGILKSYPFPDKTDVTKLSFIDYNITDPSGNIWISWHQNDGMLKFDTKEKKFIHEFKGRNYQVIVFSKGKYYTANPNFIYRHDSVSLVTDSVRIEVSYGDKRQNVIGFEDSYGRLWSESTNQGLFCYDFTKKQFYHYRKNVSGKQSLNSNFIRALAEDRSGNLWIGTDGAGVCKLDLKPPIFNIFPINEAEYPQLKDFFIRSLYEDDKKRVWFGTLSGLNIYNPADGKIIHYSHDEKNPYSLHGNIVSVIFRDSEGLIWIGHDNGVSVFVEQLNKFYQVPIQWRIPPQRSEIFVQKIVQLKNRDLIVLTNGEMVLIRRKNHPAGTSTFNSKTVLYGYSISDIWQTGDKELWVAVARSGLFNCVWVNDSLVMKEKFLPPINFRTLNQDKSDSYILWVTSDKGLIRLDTKTGKYQLYNETNGMANSFIYGILEDEQHNFWMSTNGGLVYFNRKTNSFQNFTVNEGLQSNEFNSGAFHKGATGNFYFGGVNGFNWFRSESFPKSITKPLIGITAIFVENIPFRKDSLFLQNKTVQLRYLKNDIELRVAAFDYTRPQANKIQYKLEGWDHKWITTYNKQIRYGKLLPGQYTLVIRASNNAGEWSDEERITLIVNAPFWQRTWFYLLCGLLLILIVIFITRNLSQRKIKDKLRRLEKQKAVEAERNRISKDMHDEIGSGLTRIALLTELMHTQKQLDEKTKQDVNEIADSTRQLVESMSEIIWTLNPHNDSLGDLLAYLREQTMHYFEPLNVTYKITFPDNIPEISLSNEQRRNLFLVSKEALNNALKHSGATEIVFKTEIVNGKIIFSVIDNGKGMENKILRAGSNGLINMRQRMKDIHGEIEWVFQKGNGTRVNYWINI